MLPPQIKTRSVEAVIYKMTNIPPPQPSKQKDFTLKTCIITLCLNTYSIRIHTTWSIDDLTQVISGQCTFESYLYVVQYHTNIPVNKSPLMSEQTRKFTQTLQKETISNRYVGLIFGVFQSI